MLLKMVPEAVAASWPDIERHVRRALPESENTDISMSNLLEMLLTERAQCWVSYDSKNNNKANLVVVTVPIRSGITGEMNLLLYNVTRSDVMDLKTSNRMWLEGFVALGKFMRANGFSKLVGYFDNENHRSLKLAKRFGAKITHYMEIDMSGGE